MERDLFNAMLDLSMELTQHQMLTRHASVTRRNNSSINHLLLPPRLSGSHLNSNLNQKVNLRELLNIQVKFLR
jgi:hypothetical protein